MICGMKRKILKKSNAVENGIAKVAVTVIKTNKNGTRKRFF
jgi:hypothetical protein